MQRGQGEGSEIWLRVAVEGIPGEGISRKLSKLCSRFREALLDVVVVCGSGGDDYRRCRNHYYEDQADQEIMHEKTLSYSMRQPTKKRYLW